MKRSKVEHLFVWIFVPAVVLFYLVKGYPVLMARAFGMADPGVGSFFLAGKSPGFWYMTLYTALVVFIAGRLLFVGRNPYGKGKLSQKPLSSYQRKKFLSILAVQFVGFYFLPYLLPLLTGGAWTDTPAPPGKMAHVYVSWAFVKPANAAYMFLVIPVFVWFFGKKYCTWICSCGNLAETVGTTIWGQKWVAEGTPRSASSRSLEVIQGVMLVFGLVVGFSILTNTLGIAKSFLGSDRLHDSLLLTQDLVTDLMFGSIIGVAFYPFLGTRIWCRYGCPMAKGMQIVGRFTRSRYAVVPNDKCRGLALCTKACPMGIPVDAYAHKDRKPIAVAFGLASSSCIGCGGCIESCPVDALSFARIGDKVVIAAKEPGYDDRALIKITAIALVAATLAGCTLWFWQGA